MILRWQRHVVNALELVLHCSDLTIDRKDEEDLVPEHLEDGKSCRSVIPPPSLYDRVIVLVGQKRKEYETCGQDSAHCLEVLPTSGERLFELSYDTSTSIFGAQDDRYNPE